MSSEKITYFCRLKIKQIQLTFLLQENFNLKMEESSSCVQIQVEEELPTLLRRATTEEMLGFDNYKESNLPLPHFVSRFHHSHASTTNLVLYYLFNLLPSTFANIRLKVII